MADYSDASSSSLDMSCTSSDFDEDQVEDYLECVIERPSPDFVPQPYQYEPLAPENEQNEEEEEDMGLARLFTTDW